MPCQTNHSRNRVQISWRRFRKSNLLRQIALAARFRDRRGARRLSGIPGPDIDAVDLDGADVTPTQARERFDYDVGAGAELTHNRDDLALSDLQIERSEAVSRHVLDNAFAAFVDQGYLERAGGKLSLSEPFRLEDANLAIEARMASYLQRMPGDLGW